MNVDENHNGNGNKSSTNFEAPSVHKMAGAKTEVEEAAAQEADRPKTEEEIKEEKELCKMVRQLSKKEVSDEDSSHVYVSNIDILSLGELKQFFSCVGNVKAVLRCSHYYRVLFYNPSDCNTALKLDGTEPFRKVLRVSRTVPEKPLDEVSPQPNPTVPASSAIPDSGTNGTTTALGTNVNSQEGAGIVAPLGVRGLVHIGPMKGPGLSLSPQELADELKRTVDVEGFSQSITKEQALELLASSGQILFSRIKPKQNSETQCGNYTATIEYESPESAKKAIESLNGKEVDGCIITVKAATDPITKSPSEISQLNQFRNQQQSVTRTGNESGGTSVDKAQAQLNNTLMTMANNLQTQASLPQVLTLQQLQQQVHQYQAQQLGMMQGLNMSTGFMSMHNNTVATIPPVATDASIARTLLGKDKKKKKNKNKKKRKDKKKSRKHSKKSRRDSSHSSDSGDRSDTGASRDRRYRGRSRDKHKSSRHFRSRRSSRSRSRDRRDRDR